MAFVLLSRSRSKPQGSVKPVPKQKSARRQHSADSRFGFAKPVVQPQTAALPTAPVIQTKLKVGEPNDEFEQEADRVVELTGNDNGSISPSAAARSRSPVESLQRLYGNQAVLQMRNGSGGPPAPSVPLRPSLSGILQRKCACGSAAGMSGECEECSKKQRLCLQTKLKVNEPGDIYEQEADRIADQVLAAPANAAVSGVPPRIQRFAGQGVGQTNQAPASVDRVLASSGRPLEPALRQNMEQRFGHDFSRVRVHSGAAAEQSARDVNAHAYTVGHNLVFGEGQYSPRTLAGQRLLAHELVHTLQQNMSAESAGVVHRQASLDIALRSPTVTAQVLGSEILDGFELNSHTLTAGHKPRLLALAKRLKQLLREHQLGTVEITGHTDATADEALNDQLGQDRADAVAAFLRRAGVPAMALLAESAGESALRVPTDKAEPRNRRVEIRFLPELPTPSLPTPEPRTAEPPKKPVRVPLPENLCTEHPEICDPITTKPEAMQSCRPTHCSAYGDSFDDQPPDLQLILIKSFPPKAKAAAWFKELGDERRLALQQIFNRLCRHGLLCQVRLIVRVDTGEAPVSVVDRLFDVPGRTPSVYFTSPAVKALPQVLIDTGRFCEAHELGARMHPRGATLREISGSDSLHISGEGKDQIEAHIDHYSPVPEHPGSRFCSNAPTPAAVGHITRELFPEIVREKTGIPGFQVFPEPAPPAPVPEGAVAPEPPRGSPGFSLSGVTRLLIGALLESSRITLRGPRKKSPQPLVPAEAKRVSPDVSVLSKEVVEGIRRALEEQVSPEALLPSQVRVRLTEARKAADRAGPDEEAALRDAAEEVEAAYADAHDVAFDLAVLMEQARRSHKTWVKLELDRYGSYGGLNEGNDRRDIVGEIRRIALILRNYLPDRAAGVNTVVIIFGSANLAVREEAKLPGWVEREKGIFD